MSHPFSNPTTPRPKKPNLELEPMKLFHALITTNKGWLVRQAMKYVATGLASLTAYLQAKGLSIEDPQVVQAGLSALAVALIEGALSYGAKAYAVK